MLETTSLTMVSMNPVKQRIPRHDDELSCSSAATVLASNKVCSGWYSNG